MAIEEVLPEFSMGVVGPSKSFSCSFEVNDGHVSPDVVKDDSGTIVELGGKVNQMKVGWLCDESGTKVG